MPTKLMMFLKDLGARWWALMSCAAFTFLSCWAALRNKAPSFTVVSTGCLAIIFLIVAFYLIWSEQHRRAETATALLNEEKTASEKRFRDQEESTERQLRAQELAMRTTLTFRDWDTLASQFANACQHMRADYQTTEGVTTWRLAGGANSSCYSLLQKAGGMLLNSPKASQVLPPTVANTSDNFARWCEMLHARGYSQAGLYGWEEPTESTGRKIFHFMGSVNNLASQSSALCTYISSLEL